MLKDVVEMPKSLVITFSMVFYKTSLLAFANGRTVILGLNTYGLRREVKWLGKGFYDNNLRPL